MPKPRTILESAKGGPYEKYATVYTFKKIQINNAEMMELWDKEHNTPQKITIDEIQKDGKVKKVKVENPAAMINQLIAINNIITRHQDEDYEAADHYRYYGRRFDQGASPLGEEMQIDPEGADKEIAEALKPIRKVLDSYVDSKDDDVKHFREIFEINRLPLEYERGDFARAMMDNNYLVDFYSQTGGGPRVRDYSFKELREKLDGPIDPVTGKPTKPLKLINRYYKSINELFSMEYAKQKLMDNGYTEEQEKQYLEELKAVQQQMLNAYEDLRVFESEHKGEFGTDYLNNGLDHLVDYERAPIGSFGQLKGQMRAIENGWGMDDLTVLGIMGEMDARAEFNIKRCKEKIEDCRRSNQKHENSLKEKEAELAVLRAGNEKEKIEAAEKEIKSLKSKIKENDESIVKYERQMQSNILLRKEITENESLGWNKKIEKPSDKIEILYELKRVTKRPEFADSAATHVLKSLTEEVKHLDTVLEAEYLAKEAPIEWSEKGMPGEARETSNVLSRVIDIYGPNPKYHGEWGYQDVISKKDFNANFTPYDTGELPFTDMQLAFIGMGAATLYSDKKKEILDKMRPDALGFDQKRIDCNNTTWTTDLFSKPWGPRQGLINQAPIIAEGRREAEQIAKEYAAGNRKSLAGVIHNSFRQFLAEQRTGSMLTKERTIHGYYMNKTFSDMLANDPQLQSEFDAINNAAKPGDKVDLSEIYNQTELYRNRLDSFDAASEIKAAEKQNPEADKKLVHDYIRGTVINELYMNEKGLMAGSPENLKKKEAFIKQNQKLLVTKNPNDLLLYTRNIAEYNYDNFGKPEIFGYLSTEKGRESLENFTNMLVSKYVIDKEAVKEFEKTKADKDSTEDSVEKEILKFTYETGAEKSYAELESGKEMDETKMRELCKEIIKNKVLANRVDDYLNQSELDPLVSPSEKTMKAYKGRHEVFNDIVDNFVNNMNLKDITPKELAEVLRAGEKTTIRDIANTFASVSEFAMEKKNPSAPNLTRTANMLRPGITGMFGNSEYKDIIKGVEQLDKDVKAFTKQLFEKRSDKGFEELKAKYNDVLKKMEDFQEENKQYSDYADRCERVDNAIKEMKNVMGYLNKHQGNLEAVNEYVEYQKYSKQMVKTSAEKGSGPMEYLEKRIKEEEIHRSEAVEKYLSNDKEVKQAAGKDLVKSCFNALYMQVVKEEYGPKPQETPEQAQKRNDTFWKAINRGDNGKVSDMKMIMDSNFGKRYMENCMKVMVTGKNFTQEKLLECRDIAIQQCYDDSLESFRRARNRGDLTKQKEESDELINLSRITKALGSDALAGKSLPKVREDSKVHDFNLKSENKTEHKKSL